MHAGNPTAEIKEELAVIKYLSTKNLSDDHTLPKNLELSLGAAMHKRQSDQSAVSPSDNPTVTRTLLSVAAAWVLTIGIDLLLHGGVLARQYLVKSPFLLEPEEAFRRIPLGYLAFLILTLGLCWLFRQLNVQGAWPGFRLGAIAGFVVWGALALGLYSISTISLPLMIGWWLGQSLELGLAGVILGVAANGTSLKRIWAVVVIVVVICVALTIVLQSTGWAPPMKTI